MEMRAMYAQCLGELMERDEKLVLLDADLSKACGTFPLRKRFPDRIYDCGVAEQNMISIAAGLASYGYKPWAESFAPFATRRVCDQIAISVCYAKRNVKIVGTDPGIAAELNGGTHMSLEDMGVVRSIPGLVVFEPTDTVQLQAAMPVLHAYEGPVYMRMNRKEFPSVFPEDYRFDLFKADLLRTGTDVTVLAAGLMVSESLQAAETLAAEGISCEVINVHTIKPIDRETILASAQKTGVIVTAENHNVIGGLRSAVLEALAHDPVPVWAVGAEDRFGEVGKLPYLKEALGLNAAHVAAVVREAVQHR
jgi:Transketolase, C-terminal subunit